MLYCVALYLYRTRALVRLTFHDAAGEGGPNGCVDFENTEDSNGLQSVVAQLQQLYASKGYAPLLSLADLYVLAGNTAILYASTQDGKQNATGLDPVPDPLILPFRYGRIDAQKCNDSGYLPPISYDWTQMKSLFNGRFGMSVKETVAIMGAHSVGRCQYANLGVDGGWTPTQSSFSNKYYQVFGNIKWDNNNQSNVWVDNFPGGPEVRFISFLCAYLFHILYHIL